MIPTATLTLRVTPVDLANLAIVATHLRESGEPFANRSTAVRFALRLAAGATHAAPSVASLAVAVSDKVTPAERHEMTIHFDGGAAPNPGPMQIAIAVAGGARLMQQLENGTNNLAEWRALLWGMKFAQAQGVTDVELIGDSQLVVQQANGAYRIRKPEFLPLKAEFDRLRLSFRSVRVSQVGRDDNLAGHHIEAALAAR